MDIKAVLSGLKSNYISAKTSHNETKNTVIRLDPNIYLIDYKNDYYLDEILEKGCTSIGQLMAFCTLKFNRDFLIGNEIGGGCTTFDTHNPEGDHLFARNFDFKEAPCFIVWTHPEGKHSSISVVDNNFMLYGKKHSQWSKNSPQVLLAPYCCVDGMNEQGLAIAVLQIRAAATKQRDPSKKNVITPLMTRGILDNCKDVDEAVEFIKNYNMNDPLFTNYHYQICDSTGRSVVVEYINNELKVYERNSEKYPATGSVFEDDGLDYQYVCNYSVTKDIGSFKAIQHGYDRTNAVEEALKAKGGVMTELEVMDLLSHVMLKYPHPKYPWNIISLWSAVYNVDMKTVKLAANGEFSRIYTFELAQPCTVIETEMLRESEYPKTEWEYL